MNKWLEATVIAVRADFLYVHYNGWDTRWDEWIHAVLIPSIFSIPEFEENCSVSHENSLYLVAIHPDS